MSAANPARCWIASSRDALLAMTNRSGVPSAAKGALVAAILLLSAAPVRAEPALRIAVIGDVGYSERFREVDHEAQFAALLADIGRQAPALLVHNGNLGAPAEMCADDGLLRRRAQLDAVPAPVLYGPGDNEWLDCGDDVSLLRLARLRELFFARDTTLGKPAGLVRQGAGATFGAHPENARLQLGEVTVFTLHLVGSRNNFNHPELVGRDAANRAWLKESVAAARAAQSRAVLIVMQANAFPDRAGGLGMSPQFYDELWDAIRSFPGKVAVVHGEEHQFRIDQPLADVRGRVLENFTRVQTYGTPNHHWVEIVVDYDDPNVFTFRPRLVPANVAP